MPSSGDELGSYEQSPRIVVSGTSRNTTRPVAGPSKPASKRKKAVASEDVEVDPNAKAVDTIAISSDEEDVYTTKRGKTETATAAQNGRAVSSRGKAKATARRKKIIDTSGAEFVEDTAAETDADAATFRPTKAKQAVRGNTTKNDELVRKQNERLQKQLEDVVNQRDSVATQLEELFQLRNSEVEALLIEEKVQHQATLRVKEDTIQELQNALSHADKLPKSGTATTLHFLTRETADEEKQDVQREVERLKNLLKKKDETIRAKDVELVALNENFKTLQNDLRVEIERSKTLISRSAPSSAAKHSSKSNDGKNALVISLYEDLTNLLVTNIKHQPGLFREDDAIYTCVQTTPSGKTLNFELRFYKDAEEGESPASANRSGRIVNKVVYTPQGLEKESPEFVQQLDFLANPFTFQREQMGVFTKTLLTYLEGEEEDNQSNADQMEIEG